MKIRYQLFAAVLTIAISFWLYEISTTHSPYLEVTMLDVGQGDSVFISDPRGYQLLIDGGPANSDTIGQLESVMLLLDRTINTLVLTHPDADHVSGLSDVLERYLVDTVVDNGVPKDTEAAKRFRDLTAREGAVREELYRGDEIVFPSGAVMSVLHPTKDFYDPEANNNSIVNKLTYGDVSFLFTGDVDGSVESLIVEVVPLEEMRSTVLKIPHHGSRYSSTLEFLKVVQPRFAIASYACDNDYGHPNPSAVRRYQYLKIPVYTTCDRGTFTLQTDGKTVWIKEGEGGLFSRLF